MPLNAKQLNALTSAINEIVEYDKMTWYSKLTQITDHITDCDGKTRINWDEFVSWIKYDPDPPDTD